MMNKKFAPESMMMSYGYHPEWSEGSIKCPIFQTSTFVFQSAEEGKAFFEVAYGKREAKAGENLGLIYSRINNPDLEILENRLALWDEAEDCAIFESGMSAISTVLLEYLKPGDLLLFSNPVYGGTDHFINVFLPSIGVHVLPFYPNQKKNELITMIEKSGQANNLKMVYLETPANPTNDLIDIKMCVEIANHFSCEDHKVKTVVDNTYLGPLWQHPIQLGADLIVYSATKYIGGHSDVIAGAVLGSAMDLKRIKTLRTFLGNTAGPWTGWLLLRSLETLKVRMEQQTKNAQAVSAYLQKHPKVEEVFYLGNLSPKSETYKIYQQQCLAPGAMISFAIAGGEKQAFQFLNALQMIKLAVSLGSTESLAQHPYTMTHAGIPDDQKHKLKIRENLVRLSIGVENIKDLLWDIEQSLNKVSIPRKAKNHYPKNKILA